MEQTESARKVAPAESPGAYQPIENYGVVGNLRTVALVGIDGSIDWCCLPHFDSPSIFGRLLDAGRGGHFKISATAVTTHKQAYVPDSNILITRFLSEDGVGEIFDYMPVEGENKRHAETHLYRTVRVVRGAMRFRLECVPAFNYAKTHHRTYRRKNAVIFEARGLALALHTPIHLDRWETGVATEFELKEDQSLTFILRHVERGTRADAGAKPPDAEKVFEDTLRYWHRWVGQLKYQGRWREIVTRSSLALKLLTFAPTGAIVAAPTASLPELMGGTRNWDYRFTWIRDASFTLYALLRLGFSEEAGAFMSWLQFRLKELNKDGSLNIMYGLRGEHDLRESTLDYLDGYGGSKPVRIGNGAFDQLQLDIYGELMDSIYLYNKYGTPISWDLWNDLQPLLDYVCRNWNKPDKGIWETRQGPQHFVYSKVMCWVALDRALRLATKRRLPANWSLWTKTCDEIYRDVMQKGWNPKVRAFTQHYGTTALDASTLIMPLVKFIGPNDPRMVSTLAAIKRELVSDSLVRRYQVGEGVGKTLKKSEGTFSMCTFWYVEALARSGQVQEARWIFEKMLGYANHIGLFAEEVGPDGHQLGNYPQAFTHLGLISAAYNLDRALNGEGPQSGEEGFSLFGSIEHKHPPHRAVNRTKGLSQPAPASSPVAS